MGQDRLSGLAMLHVHYDKALDKEQVLNLFLAASRSIVTPANPADGALEECAESDGEEEAPLAAIDLE